MDEDVLSFDASSMSEEASSSSDEAEAEVASDTASDWKFSPADTDLLVRLVKLCQKMGYSGGSGTWKEHVKVTLKLHAMHAAWIRLLRWC